LARQPRIGTNDTGWFCVFEHGGQRLAANSWWRGFQHGGHSIAQQVGVQALGIGATMLWCGAVTWLLLKVLQATVGLRVSEEQESEGLDLAAHGGRGYIG
jgi:ammonia channel protein AmtB